MFTCMNICIYRWFYGIQPSSRHRIRWSRLARYMYMFITMVAWTQSVIGGCYGDTSLALRCYRYRIGRCAACRNFLVSTKVQFIMQSHQFLANLLNYHHVYNGLAVCVELFCTVYYPERDYWRTCNIMTLVLTLQCLMILL